MSAPVVDVLPPPTLLRVLNPTLRWALRTPLGRGAAGLALLQFTGRRTGRDYRVPVIWRELEGTPFVLTPAPWRANFAGGAQVLVHHRGRSHPMLATLDGDAEAAARAVRCLLARGVPDKQLGMRISADHTVDTEDMRRLDRRLIRFTERVPEPRSP